MKRQKTITGMIADKLVNTQVEFIDLKTTANPNLNEFDLIIIGGSIYFGQIQKELNPSAMTTPISCYKRNLPYLFPV